MILRDKFLLPFYAQIENVKHIYIIYSVLYYQFYLIPLFIDYIAWMGTFSAFDQQSFDAFIDHTLAECLDITCPIDSCGLCQANTDLFGKLQ